MTSSTGGRAGAPSRARVFAFGSLGIRVSADDAAILDWLEEFLTPQWTVGGVRGDVDVEIQCDAALFESLLAAGPAGRDATIDCFALDSSVLRLPVWRAAEGHVVFDEPYGVFYLVDPDRRRTRLVAAEPSLRLRTPLMRVVREYASNAIAAAGGFFLHAAALDCDARGIVVVGDKGAGKTSLLTYLLQQTRGRYVANDRVCVPSPDDPTIRGMPSVVTLRPPMLEFFPAFESRLLEFGNDQRQTRAELAATGPHATRFRDGRFGMTPRQYLTAVQAPAAAATRAGLIVLPRHDDGIDGFAITKIDRDTLRRRLPSALLGAGSWRMHSDLFRLQDTPEVGANELTDRCLAWAEQVDPCEVRLGRLAYAEPHLANALVKLPRDA